MTQKVLRSDGPRVRHEFTIALLIACFPLAQLVWLDVTYYWDWNRHLWMIGYVGEYLRHHLSFPTTFSTITVVGLPFPIFYGTLFYPVAGLLSALTGAAIALRIIVVGLFWLQCVHVARLVRTVYPNAAVAWGVAAVVAFAVYPMTNLYNRNAMTELVAVSLLVSACAIWLRILYTSDGPATGVSVSFVWLLLTLSAGSHPITAVLGGGLFAILLTAGMLGSERRRTLATLSAINAAMFALVLAPWVYVTQKFQRDLGVAVSMRTLLLWPDSIDKWWIRLLPVPFDLRPVQNSELRLISTPYLDAQINAGLVILSGFLVFQLWRRLRSGEMKFSREAGAALACLVLSAAVCYASVSVSLWRVLPTSLGFFQFAYRLVTYCDLLLLAAVVLLLSAHSQNHAALGRPLRLCLTAALAVMTVGVLVKLTHAAAVQSPGALPGTGIFTSDRGDLRQLPQGLPFEDYRDLVGFAGELPDTTVVKLTVGVRTHFGDVERVVVSPKVKRIATNIEAFPWNRVVVDGREVPMAETHTTGSFLSVVLPEDPTPVQHSLGYAFKPDRLYSVLRTTSGIVLACWAAGLLCWSLYVRRRPAAPRT